MIAWELQCNLTFTNHIGLTEKPVAANKRLQRIKRVLHKAPTKAKTTPAYAVL